MNKDGFAQSTMNEFLSWLGEASPTPGGGSAASLAGAAAAALLEMVAGVSGRRKDADEGRAQELRQAASRLREALCQRVDDDARAYQAVDEALKLPKETEKDAQIRRTALQEALLGAAEVPLRVAEEAVEVLRVAKEIMPLRARPLTSDISCAVRLAHACAMGALDNVDANALSIKDTTVRERLKERQSRLAREVADTADAILAELNSELSAWR